MTNWISLDFDSLLIVSFFSEPYNAKAFVDSYANGIPLICFPHPFIYYHRIVAFACFPAFQCIFSRHDEVSATCIGSTGDFITIASI